MPKGSTYIGAKHMKCLNEIATNRGVNKSAVLADVLNSVALGKKDVRPVVLQIPARLLSSGRPDLERWLEARVAGIVDNYYPLNAGTDGVNPEASE